MISEQRVQTPQDDLHDDVHGGTGDTELRERAVKRLKKQRDFTGHLLIYVLVNSFFVLIWAVTNLHGFFWPIFPIVGWGIGIAMNAWDVFQGDDFSEEQVRREMERMGRHR